MSRAEERRETADSLCRRLLLPFSVSDTALRDVLSELIRHFFQGAVERQSLITLQAVQKQLMLSGVLVFH